VDTITRAKLAIFISAVNAICPMLSHGLSSTFDVEKHPASSVCPR